MKRTHPLRAAFTLVELLTVIAIIALLIAMLLPTLRRARDQAQRVTCHSNLRQLCLAMIAYATERGGWLPGPISIIDPPGPETVPIEQGLLYRTGHVTERRLWQCPADLRRAVDPSNGALRDFSYTYNGRMYVKPGQEEVENATIVPYPHHRRLTSFRRPAEDIVLAEENTRPDLGRPWINDAYFIYVDVTDNRHLGKAAVVYLDGHTGDLDPMVMLWFDPQRGYCR